MRGGKEKRVTMKIEKATPAIPKNKKPKCMHDYKNAIPVDRIYYMCPLCEELLDPLEWFFMNSFEFVDVSINKP